MQNKSLSGKQLLLWSVSGVLLIVGLFFCIFCSGCSFLGIFCCCTALIPAIFALLHLWQTRSPRASRIVRRWFCIILVLVLLASLVTLIPILLGPPEVKGRSDYLIVLGAGVNGTEPSRILQDRIDMAADYLQRNPDVICIATGGKGSDENLSEAQCIYNHLTAKGIDGSRILLEDQATSTIENFRYSLALIEAKTGAVPERVTVLSNEFHLFRASRMAKDCGLQADYIAAPTSSALIRLNYTLREIFAFWKYLIMGG